jgi:urocanate hydratase
LSTLGWPQEGALRMLQNNLDPEVAERPDDLVVYGGTGRAARDWRSFDALVRTLTHAQGRRDDAGPVGPAGGRLPDPRVGAARADRQLEPGPDWATWPEFRRLEALGLTMYGQMTAGSWIYIGTQGILQGTYETFSAVANHALRRHASRARSP